MLSSVAVAAAAVVAIGAMSGRTEAFAEAVSVCGMEDTPDDGALVGRDEGCAGDWASLGTTLSRGSRVMCNSHVLLGAACAGALTHWRPWRTKFVTRFRCRRVPYVRVL
mgnify:CR=1 FL=1